MHFDLFSIMFDRRYEIEAKFFDEGVKNTKRHDVLEKNAYEVGYLLSTSLISAEISVWLSLIAHICP